MRFGTDDRMYDELFDLDGDGRFNPCERGMYNAAYYDEKPKRHSWDDDDDDDDDWDDDGDDF